ncbi:MAG: histidinol-phosphate transaminase [Candidatus Polarisedimenticolaceae bacterium]|nr:histidinol-phosphate transaminase [Candidatus Polarisedimenticolaceae bacterium]
MSQFWSPIVHKLTPYVPGEQPKAANLIKLNTNENPYGPSPKVLRAMQGALDDSLRLYPDPNADALKQAIASYYQLKSEQVFVGNGSDEVLAHIFHGLLKQDRPILFPDITYSFYPVYCGLYEVASERVALTDDYKVGLENYSSDNGGIIFPNPNAPTGELVSLADIEALLKRNSGSVVVVDEAYIDFGGESAVTLVDRYANLLVIQTLSKSRALAGIRVGFALGNASLIEALERVKNSFNSYPLDRPAMQGAIAAIEDRDYFERSCQRIIDTREDVTLKLQQFGFQVLPSAANFIFVRHPERDAAELAEKLREKAIIVRHFKQPRIEQFLRITIGTDDEMAALCSALAAIL